MLTKRGNKRTTKEGSGDLKFQNFALPKIRSWPGVNSAIGPYHTVTAPRPNCERNTTAALDRAKFPADTNYEDPELQMVDVWPSVKILPARPIKESEYADTRCFRDASSLQYATPVTPPPRRMPNPRLQPEEMDKPFSKETRSQHVTAASSSVPIVAPTTEERLAVGRGKQPGIQEGRRGTPEAGDKSIQGNKTPIPPPSKEIGQIIDGPPPTLPKKYQPLPPTPPENYTSTLQLHVFPEAQRGPRQISLKDISEVLQAEKVSHHQKKPESSRPLEKENAQKTPPPITSSSLMLRSHNMQDRDHKGGAQASCLRRCPSPAGCGPGESSVPSTNTSLRKPLPPRSAAKDAQHNEWYIGEYSRQVVEEALMQENKDGTFLVRDCSSKSMTEPYVLVVFYGNKVYNVKIRFLERNRKFALGTGRRGNQKFDSVEDIIEHYKHCPILLIDGKDKSGGHREECYLTQPLPLSRHLSPQ